MADVERAYLCDGHGCDKNCGDMPAEEWQKHYCHHTKDESHAKNKVRRKRKWVFDGGKFLERES